MRCSLDHLLNLLDEYSISTERYGYWKAKREHDKSDASKTKEKEYLKLTQYNRGELDNELENIKKLINKLD